MVVDPAPADAGTEPRSRAWSARAVPAAVALATLAAGTMLVTVDPYEPGHYPRCPFLATTGLYCPGCGSLRAVHDLLHGDLQGALARNPAAVLAVPYLAVAVVGWGLRATGRPAPRSTSLTPWLLWTLLAGILAFGVARNLPGMSWLSPE